jgi:predicted nuclease of restriction endonuclease-like RecB superfamily
VLEKRCIFGNELLVNPIELRAVLFNLGPVTVKGDLLTTTTRAQAVAETAAHFNITFEEVEQALRVWERETRKQSLGTRDEFLLDLSRSA